MFNNISRKKISPVLALVFLTVSSCTKYSSNLKNRILPGSPQKDIQVEGNSTADSIIRSDYKKGEISVICNASMEKAKASLDQIAKIAPADRTTDNTLLAFENTTTEMLNETSPVTFMGYVSKDADIRAEASDCEAAISQFNIDLGIRRDLYQAIENAQARHPKESRLLKMTKEFFEQNGLKLSDDDLQKIRELKGKLSANENQFSENLNNDNTQVLFDSDELEGVPADYLADLKKDSNGKLIVNTKESDYSLVMETAVRSESRKKMMQGYFSRGGDANSKLLSESVQLRAQIAKLLGFKSWADYRTNGRMVQNSQKALDFLNGLKGKLAQTNSADFAKLLKFKQETIPNATKLDQWDISYYTTQLKKRDYSLDKEKIREYFPADVVIAGMFQVYSKMLGVRFEQIKDAKAWAENVQLYAIYDAQDSHLIGHFYTDFFPREGKYGHAAAWQLISGYELADGSYKQTVSAIVANLTPPMNGKPSLLDHEDVDTIFHEFGHVRRCPQFS